MNQRSNNKKLKALLITNLFPNPEEPFRGIFIANMAREAKHECDLTVVSPLPWFPRALKWLKKYGSFSMIPHEFDIDGIKVYSPKYLAIPKMGALHPVFIFLALWKTVSKIKKEQGIDLINAHWVFPDGVSASWIARLLKIPFILSARGCDINLYSKFILRRPQIINAVKAAYRITSVSQAQKETICKMGIPENKIMVIRNGVDIERFALKNREQCRSRLGLSSMAKIILFVGQFVEVKGFNYLIEAIARLYDEGKRDLRLIAIGNGPLKEGYRNKISKLGLGASVLFAGEKSRDEIPYWYGACDLLCLPSIREGCPNVVLEALASGRPVVASKVGGIPELLNEKNGILFTPRDVGKLSEALRNAMERTWYPGEIRNTVIQFSWKNVASEYIANYEKVMLAAQRGLA